MLELTQTSFSEEELTELLWILEWRKKELEDYIADGITPEICKKELKTVETLIQKLKNGRENKNEQ